MSTPSSKVAAGLGAAGTIIFAVFGIGVLVAIGVAVMYVFG